MTGIPPVRGTAAFNVSNCGSIGFNIEYSLVLLLLVLLLPPPLNDGATEAASGGPIEAKSGCDIFGALATIGWLLNRLNV